MVCDLSLTMIGKAVVAASREWRIMTKAVVRNNLAINGNTFKPPCTAPSTPSLEDDGMFYGAIPGLSRGMSQETLEVRDELRSAED